MARQPLVSVIIPAYNHEKFIGAAVDSVLGQTMDDLELIVIDDGSQDRTGELVRAYKDTRVSYYYQENQDAYNTLNRGLSMARGQFISILNSDDVYHHNRLKRMLECRAESGSDCIITDVIPISAEGEVFTDPDFGWNQWHARNRAFYFECGDLYTAFLKGNFMVTTSNFFMAREVVETVGKFCSLRYLHDYDYIFRILLAFPNGVQYLSDEKLLSYRIHSGNTLGEAAITGRVQDQELIQKYMLARIPARFHKELTAASERLVGLGEELHEVKMLLQPGHPQGVRPALNTLRNSLKQWLKKKLP